MNIQITKVGNRVKILNTRTNDSDYVAQSNVSMTYIVLDNTVQFNVQGKAEINSFRLPIAKISIGGVTITNQSVFDTQVALVFI